MDDAKKDDLEDSSDESDNEEAPRKKSRVSKMRHVQQLDEDDLDHSWPVYRERGTADRRPTTSTSATAMVATSTRS